MGGSSSLHGFRLVCSLRATPLSRSLSFPVFQESFGLDVLSDPPLLKPEPPPPARTPGQLQPEASVPGPWQNPALLPVVPSRLEPQGAGKSPPALVSGLCSGWAGGRAVKDPKFCRNWDQPSRVCLHGGVKRLGTGLLRRPGQKARQPLGKLPGLRAASTPPFHSLVSPQGGYDGHPHENMTLLSTVALLTVVRRWTQPNAHWLMHKKVIHGLGAWWATGHGVTQSQTRLKRLSTHVHMAVHTTGCYQSRSADEALTEPSDGTGGEAGHESTCCPTALMRNVQKRRGHADRLGVAGAGEGCWGRNKGIRAFFGKNVLECSRI